MNCNHCHKCLEGKKTPWGSPVIGSRMILCPDCGNKRCPKANDHDNTCTRSNAVGQEGSAYPDLSNPRKLSTYFMKNLGLLFCILFALTFAARAQTPCPTGLICLTQEQANIAAQNAKDVVLQKAQIAVRDDALKEKDKSIQEVKDTAAQNVADITARLHASENALATSTGQLIGSEAEKVRLLAIIDALLKMTRKKCLPLSVCIN